MNLNKPTPLSPPKRGEERHDVPKSVGSSSPSNWRGLGGGLNLYTMKKLLRFIGIISLIAVSLAVYSFGNVIVQDCAMIDLERTINYIESSLLGLLCVAFISLTIMFWREDL